MTPPSRSPDQRAAGYPPRGGRGAAGPAGLDNGLAGGPSGIGVAGGAAGFGVGGGPVGVGVGGGPVGFGVGGGPGGTGQADGPARMEAGGPAGADNGVVGSARIGAASSRPGIGNGLTGSAGVGATGSPGSGPTADSGTGAIGGLPYGLVQRVQRRLASTGSVATDTAGLRTAVTEALSEDGILLPAANLTPIVRAVGDELTGLGPLAPLLADPTVTDVLVNGPTEVWVERGGSIERAAVRFASPAAVAALVQRVVAPLGLRVDESRPWVDARLPGGERFHAVLPPLAPDGPVITIRTFARRRLQLSDLIDRGALDVATARLLEAMVAAGIAIAVSGATGTGKTTLLNVLAAAIPTRERIVTIEDVAELSLPGPHVVRLEARPPNVEGRGEVPLRELVRNALRMRPDRIVVGEVRGPEVLDMLQAANTGHRGLMTTLHAGGPDEVPARLEAMALSAPGARLDVVRRLVRGGIGAVVHLERTLTGRPTRRVSVVAELVTTDDGRARAIPLRTATSNTELSATGHVPSWADHLDPVVLPAFEPTHLAGRVRVLCPRSPIR
jgi:pilus assembly protein CpaF